MWLSVLVNGVIGYLEGDAVEAKWIRVASMDPGGFGWICTQFGIHIGWATKQLEKLKASQTAEYWEKNATAHLAMGRSSTDPSYWNRPEHQEEHWIHEFKQLLDKRLKERKMNRPACSCHGNGGIMGSTGPTKCMRCVNRARESSDETKVQAPL